MAEVLLTSEAFVKSATGLRDNLAGAYLLPSIREAQEAGDSTAYMRLLRQGLSQAPKMKKMVQFLLDETGFTKVSGVENPATRLEIAAMAEKVQAILAKYAPDDPAVIALKQSELYKKALGLIETKKAEDNCISYPSEESHHK